LWAFKAPAGTPVDRRQGGRARLHLTAARLQVRIAVRPVTLRFLARHSPIPSLMAALAEVISVPTRTESASTLRTIVELLRSILRADVTSVVTFSLADDTITWRAASGFRDLVIDDQHPLTRSITNDAERRAIANNQTLVLEGIGRSPELPADHFPIHAAAGIHDLAMTPLRVRGEVIGALLAGYREPHHFTDQDKQQLEDLATLATLALDNARLLKTISAAEKVWEQTFDAIGEGIVVHDSAMRIVRCNATAAEMMNRQPHEIIGLTFKEAFTLLFGEKAATYYLTDDRGPASAFEVQTEGQRRFLVSVFPIQKPDGEQVSVVTWNDVTRIAEMQEQLARTRRLASVGQLAAGVAHEINNPLAAITTCAEATMRDMRQTSETQTLAETHQWTYYLEEIVRQSLRCKEITRGLLDLTHQRKAARVMCDLNALAKQCAKVAVQRAGSAAEFEIKLDESIGEISTDPALVRQILDNLFSNAIDALGATKGTVSLSTLRDGDRLGIEVADTGCGISSDSMSRIFDPFFSMKGPGKGYGLGLAISLSLAESLGGALTVESKEGEGSRFRLWIPRRRPEESSSAT
jgi:PAS domain S-box-containing protein